MDELVHFRLLGPLEIAAERGILEIGSSRQRIVMSMLLLQANQVVPVGRLIDAVWAKSPPTTAKSQVQTCISALRRLLADAGSTCTIATRSVGYAILIADHELDV